MISHSDDSNSVRQLFQTAGLGDVHSLIPISVGLSGASVSSVLTSSGEYILRTQRTDSQNWAHQIAAHRAASQAGVAPALIFVDDRTRTTISQKIEGQPLGLALKDPQTASIVIRGLQQTLRRLHSIPLEAKNMGPPELHRNQTAPTPRLQSRVARSEFADFDMIKTCQDLWQQQSARPGFPGWAVTLELIPEQTRELIKNDHRKVMSHNDLNPSNAIWDGSRLWLLDWELAGANHPYYDWAVLSTFLSLPDQISMQLLGQQEGHEQDSDEAQIFRQLQNFCCVGYGAVFLRLIPDLTSMPRAESTLALNECFRKIGQGQWDAGRPEIQWQIAHAFFRTAAARFAK